MSKPVEVRDIAPEEAVLIKELHNRMGIEYPFPNISDPLFAVRRMVIDETGNVSAAAALKIISEAFLWLDPDGSEHTKTSDILRLAQVCHERAKLLDLQDVTAWVPPSVEPIFGNMLSRLGWGRSPWASWSLRI